MTETHLSDDVVERVINRTIERCRQLHDYAGRPAWEHIIGEEIRAALEAARYGEMRDCLSAMLLEHDAGQITLATSREARALLSDIEGA